jgi:superfamily II helicase
MPRPSLIHVDQTGASCDFCEREDRPTVYMEPSNVFADEVYVCEDCLLQALTMLRAAAPVVQ